MNTVYKWLLGMAVIMGMMSCEDDQALDINDMLSTEEEGETVGDALNISDLTFSEDNKVISLRANLKHDVGDYDLTDSTKVVAKLEQQVQIFPNRFINESKPEIKKISNPSKEQFEKLDIKMLLLVDLSIPQNQIDAERVAAKEIKALFGDHGLYVAFMDGDNVTETYEATDYVINNHFVHRGPEYIYLYRSVLVKLDEMMDENTTLGTSSHRVLVIMSGGKTYDNDEPIDPKHFALQQTLANKARELKGRLWGYYINFSDSSQGEEDMLNLMDVDNSEDSNILHYFCKTINGLYQTKFDWQEIEKDMLQDFNIDLSGYLLTLENPDGKIFRGNLHNLELSFFDKTSGDLIAKGSTVFALGTAYNPVIVHDISKMEVLIGGIIVTLAILLLVWLIMQYLEPYIRYRYFKHKYVISYTGNKMSIEGNPVAEACYLCKAPFETGDELVVKCSHTMHKECWDENEYHCPEHGRHCKEGSHYYNKKDLSDSRNALHYMKWVIIAVVAGFFAWDVFISHDHPISASIIQFVDRTYHEMFFENTGENTYMYNYGFFLSDLPAFGQAVAFMLTLFLSFFTVRRRKWSYRIAEMLLRAVIAGATGCICCLLGCFIFLALHLDSSTYLVDWIPWALLSCVIMLSVTIKTRTPIRKSFMIAALAIAAVSMILWGFVYFNTFINYRISLLLCFIGYSVAIAVCVARVTPSSEKFFLHVEGAVKEMDIALYKWFRAAPQHEVTIGKSVDSTIQLSWDVNGQIAPVQAEIRRHIGSIRIKALEEGVIIGDKPLDVGKEEWLWHGRKFTIGNTTFTYIEKDL